MYRDPMQWEFIRRKVLQEGMSQRAVSRETGISTWMIAKIIAHKKPPIRKTRTYSHPRLGPHIPTIHRLIAEESRTPLDFTHSINDIYEHLRSCESFTGGYSTVRDYVTYLRRDRPKKRRALDIWEHARDTLAAVEPEDARIFLRSMSQSKPPSLSRAKVQNFMRVTTLYAEKSSVGAIEPSAEDRARDWLHSIVVGSITREQVFQDMGECDELPALLTMAQNSKRIVRNRALAILAARRGISGRATNRILGIARHSYQKYLQIYEEHGIEGLLVRKPSSNRKFDSEPLKQAIFSLLHEPPSNYNINRTTWRMADFKEIPAKKGHPACPDVIRTITKNAGYRWRKARLVLTSQDPEYQQKLARIQSILSNLEPNEAFFSIDEFGPFAVKHRQGRKLVAPGEAFIVPQWQKSKGCLILTAALELSSNQVTHFYSKKKNTSEMIRLMDVLVQKYSDQKRIYLSWDAASWHISKKLHEHIESHNNSIFGDDGPQVQTAPLPSGAQFLNVIESVFSGMARAIIHNSDYGSVDEAKAAIDQYFEDRNANFARNPRRAGKKIWGEEREPAKFSCANNCKDPRYR